MNGHRTAIAALLTAARDERSRAAGPSGSYEDRARLDDRITTLDAALTAGDEAEEDDDEDDEGLTPAQVVESHLTLRALRRSLARALGRRMVSHALLAGPPTDLEPPTDDVMLSEVEDLRRGALARREVVDATRKALDLPRTTPDAEIPGLVAEAHKASATVTRERREHRRALDDVGALVVEQGRKHDLLMSALHVLVGAENVDPLDPESLLRALTVPRDLSPERVERAVALVHGVRLDNDGETGNTETRQD
jgi:hypothetical protein